MTGAPATWDEVAALYPGTSNVSYLDSAAVGLISTRVRQAMDAVLEQHQLLGNAASSNWPEHAARVRSSIARLVGGRADRVAFMQNTSTGLATVANGLDWREGDNVVVPTAEFPSNFYVWTQLRRRGVQVREVPMTDGAARIEDLREALDSRTRVLALSAVQYSSGHRYDLTALGQACRDDDVLLVVDGTQAVGAVTLDADESGIDVLAGSAHKWLLGPLGTGFLHLSQRAMHRLAPSTVGWLSVEDPFAFAHEPVLARDGRRFESGTENRSGIAGLGASVDLVLELGRSRVEDRVLDRVAQLETLLTAEGLAVELPALRERRSGIVMARSATTSPAALHERLWAQGVRCSLRGDRLRFAPHYFTSDSDLERVAEALRHSGLEPPAASPVETPAS